MEEKVLQYILGYESDNGHVPSLAQIAEDLGWRSRGSAKIWVDILIAKGRLKKIKPYQIYYKINQ